MATVTFTMSRPAVPSPLSHSSHAPQPPKASRQIPPSAFPISRALRPFPAITRLVQPSPKSVKLIQPPKNFKPTFVLDLTQAEFSRQLNLN